MLKVAIIYATAPIQGNSSKYRPYNREENIDNRSVSRILRLIPSIKTAKAQLVLPQTACRAETTAGLPCV